MCGFELAYGLRINASLRRYRLVYHRKYTFERSIVFTFVLRSNLLTWLGKVVNIISRTSSNWADLLVSLLKKNLVEMIVINGGKGNTDKHKEITNGWNYDDSYTLT
jgi:hypothetical protein